MFNLIKFEWKKMSSYRNISIAMIIILGIVTIITQNNNNDYEIFSILIIGSVSATLAFLIVGTILNTKSDIDDSSSIGLYVPKSGVSIFASKIINITLHFIIFIIIFFIVMGLKEIINDNSVLNDIPSLITSAYPEIFLSYLDYAIILLVYICLLYISLLITKSITGRTNVLYVLLVFIAITFIITIIAKSLNHYLGLVYDLKTMNIVNMNTSNSYIFELDKSNTIMTNTFLEHNFDNPDNNILYLSYGVYLPSLIISIFTIIFSNLLGGYLIDNKIDFKEINMRNLIVYDLKKHIKTVISLSIITILVGVFSPKINIPLEEANFSILKMIYTKINTIIFIYMRSVLFGFFIYLGQDFVNNIISGEKNLLFSLPIKAKNFLLAKVISTSILTFLLASSIFVATLIHDFSRSQDLSLSFDGVSLVGIVSLYFVCSVALMLLIACILLCKPLLDKTKFKFIWFLPFTLVFGAYYLITGTMGDEIYFIFANTSGISIISSIAITILLFYFNSYFLDNKIDL